MTALNSKSGSIVEIEKVIRTYFDLLYKGDKDLIETVFLQKQMYIRYPMENCQN
ncbi:MAG: hypothetical protein Ct9H300mP28_33500 [Pseudomonadota bacterium]|nr:MAG: hypothetical protein Ct9H300mP28_33500 [Pseudomonadota bacterium]